MESALAKLKRMYADLGLGTQVLKDLIKKALSPMEKQMAVRTMRETYEASQQAAFIERFHRTYRNCSTQPLSVS